MDAYVINQAATSSFVESFPRIYRHFMDFGGVVFSDQDLCVRVKKLFFACAICNNMNWDFLCKTAIPRLYDISNGFGYYKVCTLDKDTIERVFADYPKKHKIEADKRLKMLEKLSNYTCNTNRDIFKNILNTTRLMGENGLSNLINSIPVFEDDPLHKKGNLLIQILLREGLVNVEDEYNVEPSIDYHVIRFFLRYGFFDLGSNEIHRLSAGDTFSLEETTALRQSIAECMQMLAKAGISIAKMGFIAWSIGRNYCRNDYVSCEHGEKCPVSLECYGNKELMYRKLKEPESNVGFY